jgi:hypothetical protein
MYFKLRILILLLFVQSAISAQLETTTPAPRGKAPPWELFRPTFYDRKMTEAQKRILSPSPETQAMFATFLREANTGLFRLLPAGQYEFNHTVAADRDPDTVMPIMGGGAYYSFTERTHKFGPWSDIHLKDNRLIAGPTNIAVGIITNLGDIPLGSVDINTRGIGFIAKLAPPKTYSDLVDLHRRAFHGFEANGVEYGSVITTTPDATYVLRSISYKKDGYLVYPNDPYTRLDISRLGYDGSDVLIAFRIVARHEDGNLEILWKRLQRFQNPKIRGEPQIHSIKSLKFSIDRELSPGTPLTSVISFLDLNGIEHSDYVKSYHDENAASGTTGMVNATVPRIERRSRAIFDLQLQFYVNDKKELIDCALKKVRQ